MNQVYLQTKREKTINEMVLIRRMKKSPTQMIGAGLVEQSKAMRIKKYQMSILNKIETSKKSVLRRWLVLCRRKLCNNCRRGLKHGDLKCARCLNVFILADMIRRSF